MDIISKIEDFNILVARKEKAEKWFDLPTTTDTEREKWFPGILEICDRLVELDKELKDLGYQVKPEEYWQGIKLV